MRVILLTAAQAELDDAADYYAEHASPRIAQAFLDAFQHACQRVAEHPEMGTSVSKRLRILPLRHFPYSVIYRLSADVIVIQAIAHRRRVMVTPARRSNEIATWNPRFLEIKPTGHVAEAFRVIRPAFRQGE